ncbi:hypothetical protein TNCV_2238511 [Trichonephila clavipes]|nr:hypothetical protein TNCV_2238511 [Trichonephila clavipes]
MCTNCSSEPASSAHILKCLELTKQDLADDPLLVLDFLKVYDVMSLDFIDSYPLGIDVYTESELMGEHWSIAVVSNECDAESTVIELFCETT